jgi:hypothetical protein
MRSSSLRLRTIPALRALVALGPALLLAGCPGPATVTVTPPDAKVLTCSSIQLKTSDTADPPGTWSVSPSPEGGSIEASGLYQAPLQVPSSPDVHVSYRSAAGEPASATIHLATAHPGTPVVVSADVDGTSVPFEHAFNVSRSMGGKPDTSRVYGVYPGPGADAGGYPHEIHIVRSDDGGATFAAPVVFPTDALGCVSSAVDADDPDVLYMVYSASVGGAESHVRLAVSEDGGKTFAHEYTIAATMSGGLGFICPDVTSPSKDQVLITGDRTGGNPPTWVGAFPSGHRGADYPDQGAADPFYSPKDTNASAPIPCFIDSNGEQRSPRVFSDGNHHACVAYSAASDAGCSGGQFTSVYVQCSGDDGNTWSAPKVIGTTGGTKSWPTGAFSADGKVALTWLENTTPGGADTRAINVMISDDAGATFGAPKKYPFDPAVFGDPSFYTGNPVVAWEGGILWLSQTINGSDSPTIVVDKTCDEGLTWSGAVAVSPAGDYFGASLLDTSRGVAVTGFGIGNGSARPTTLFPLTP